MLLHSKEVNSLPNQTDRSSKGIPVLVIRMPAI